MAYTLPINHPLLSPAAKRLTQVHRAAEQRVAEAVLRFVGTAYVGDAILRVLDALAMQISLQIAKNPREYLATSTTKGSRSISFRGDVPIHPLSAIIAEELEEEDAEVPSGEITRRIQSLR